MVNQLANIDKNHIINNIKIKLDTTSLEDLEAKDNDNNSVWHLLAQDQNVQYNKDAIQQLINKTKKDINSKNNKGETPLDIIFKSKYFNSEAVLKTMLDNGARTSFDLKEYLSKNNSYLLQSVILTKDDLETYLKNENYFKELINSNTAGNYRISNFYAHISRISEDARKLLADKLLEHYKEDENYQKIIGEYKDIEPTDEYYKELKKMFLNSSSSQSADIYKDFANKAKDLVHVLKLFAEEKKEQEEQRLKEEKREQKRLQREQKNQQRLEEERVRREDLLKKAAEEKTAKLATFQNNMDQVFKDILSGSNDFLEEEWSGKGYLREKIKVLATDSLLKDLNKISVINSFVRKKILDDHRTKLKNAYAKYEQLKTYSDKDVTDLEKAKAFAQNPANNDFIEKFNENKKELNKKTRDFNKEIFARNAGIANNDEAFTLKVSRIRGIILKNKQDESLRYTASPGKDFLYSFTSFLDDDKTDYFTFTNKEIEEQLDEGSKDALKMMGIIALNDEIEALKKKHTELVTEGNLKDNFKEWQDKLYYADDFDKEIQDSKQKLKEKQQAQDDFKQAFESFTNDIKTELEKVL